MIARSADGRYTIEVQGLDDRAVLVLRDYGYFVTEVRSPEDLPVDLSKFTMDSIVKGEVR